MKTYRIDQYYYVKTVVFSKTNKRSLNFKLISRLELTKY